METLAVATIVPVFLLIATACLPTTYANANPKTVRRLVTWVVAFEFALSVALAIAFMLSQEAALAVSLISAASESGIGIGLYYDGATSLMLMLVAFVGLIVSRFSVRYLDGESMQGTYFRWLSLSIGAVSMMIVAGNLLMFFAAWVMTSFGLHQLLLHYRHRRAAHRAAWTKFSISRLGDALLISALVLTFETFGTFDLAELFKRATELAGSAELTASHIAIGWLLMLGAVTKSAQFPFHTWLPDTMETPTPVSALMHAGIVNAGGFLIIRMSPLVVLAPNALLTLALIGAFTAFFAGVIMLTQSNVKRTLAYSTIAQMGFMMLQCGLGAFSAAMLHILAHSLYKAHAFLSTGEVVSQSLATKGAKTSKSNLVSTLAYLLVATVTVSMAFAGISAGFGLDVAAKPGGLVLAFILCLALTTWGWRVLTLGDRHTAFYAMLGMTGLSVTYVASYLAIDRMMHATAPQLQIASTPILVAAPIAAAFASLFVLHVLIANQLAQTWLAPLRVHASNGFYVSVAYRRIFASLTGS